MWMLIEGFHQGKATALGFVSGILAGLVAITPAAGVVQPMGALILGAAASVVCYLAIILKNRLGYDDSLDAFGIHGMGGIVGAILLSFFIRQSWMDEAAAAAGGSWSVLQQLGVQVAAVLIAIVYAAVLTYLLLLLVEKVVGLRAPAGSEMKGLDDAYHGERGYGMLNPN
jgi:Amt family ammonium transporter